MRKHLLLSRFAAVLAAAAIFVSGCYHHVPFHPFHPKMDRSAVMPYRQVSKADRAGYTVAVVERAMRLYDAQGREAALEYYNSPESVDGEWYVFIFDEDEKLIALAINPDMLGEDLRGDVGVDFTGYRHGEAIAGATGEGMWVDYFFLNPVTGNQEWKHSWVVRHDGLIFGSGWYQNLPALPAAVTKAQPAEYTVAVVDRAVRYYKAHGREETVAHYNSPQSVDGDWYVFIVDENDLMIAHVDPGRLGRDLKGDLGVDVNGYRFGDQILSTTEAGLWVDYVHISPLTDQPQAKHTWVVRYDGLIFGSGWYE
ncbi:MAG: hypothetical protein OXO50_01970 [Caldilineaceae bacterium]|nr:hypothetical protein [Caldilineaceae bacterium]